MAMMNEEINKYLERSLAKAIKSEEDGAKMMDLIRLLNSIIANFPADNRVYGFEFVVENDEIFLKRCAGFFCPINESCPGKSCSLDNFILNNKGLSTLLFDRMQAKVAESKPNYFLSHTIFDYIKEFLGGDDEYFDVIMIGDDIFINEEYSYDEEAEGNAEVMERLKEILESDEGEDKREKLERLIKHFPEQKALLFQVFLDIIEEAGKNGIK